MNCHICEQDIVKLISLNSNISQKTNKADKYPRKSTITESGKIFPLTDFETLTVLQHIPTRSHDAQFALIIRAVIMICSTPMRKRSTAVTDS